MRIKVIVNTIRIYKTVQSFQTMDDQYTYGNSFF